MGGNDTEVGVAATTRIARTDGVFELVPRDECAVVEVGAARARRHRLAAVSRRRRASRELDVLLGVQRSTEPVDPDIDWYAVTYLNAGIRQREFAGGVSVEDLGYSVYRLPRTRN